MLVGLIPALLSTVSAQCAMYNQCGTLTKYGAPLPCINETSPQPLQSNEAIELLSFYCGSEFAEGAVCCSDTQVDELVSNLKRVEPLIASCPACKRNFFDVFCRFSCSPHQASFLEIVRTQKSLEDKVVPKEVNYYLDLELAENVYKSCSDVKFSATNGRVMDLIGGGAKNYPDFFKFLGDEKPMLGGSSFQINFPWDTLDPLDPVDSGDQKYVRQNETEAFPCGSGELKCSCIDCDSACPQIIDLTQPEMCTIGPLSCVSMALVLSYSAFLAACVLFCLQGRKSERTQSAMEIQRLIEDEDEHQDIYLFDLRQESENIDIEPYGLNQWLSSCCYRIAQFCSSYPSLVIIVCVLFILCSSLGLLTMRFETDPIKLWVAPDSREAVEKRFFDEQFGGFYRTQQLFIVNETGPILDNYEIIDWMSSIEQRVASIRTPILYDSLDTFCLKPVNDACVVESITQFGVKDGPRWKRQLERCIKEPVVCLPKFQQPIDPNLVFGRTKSDESEYTTAEEDITALVSESPHSPQYYLNTSTLVITWVVRNGESPIYKQRVSDWEKLIEEFFSTLITEEADSRGLRISYNLESSLERELAKSGRSDVFIVAISYILMFAYVSLSLGDSLWLGFVGVCVVLCSIISSAGILSMLGYKLSLIVTEVIPFLALAIGVDNIFLLVNQVTLTEQVNPASLPSVEEQISNAVGSVGPSIVLSTLCEATALAVATMVEMPAVRNFAIFAYVTIIVNSVLQLTLFIAIFSIYMRKQLLVESLLENESFETNTLRHQQSFQGDPRGYSFFISTIYAPFILGKRVKQVLGCVFMIMLAFSLYVIPHVSLGLDQRLAVPKDSFLVDYFTDVYDYLNVGPPVYFVVAETGVQTREMQQKLCSRFSTCETNSLVNILNTERKRPEVSYFSPDSSPASWIDDFFMWLNPSFDKCCIEHGEVCYAEDGKHWGFDMEGFPEDEEFLKYLNKWINQPSDSCPLAGKAPYSDALNIDMKSREVLASSFRINHAPLKSQNDYIHAYSAAREIAERIKAETQLEVFPYSIFYAFFAQYSTIVKYTFKLVFIALFTTFLISFLLLGSLKTAVIVAVVVTSLLVNMGGAMWLLDINLNALSLVNLVICVGVAVEFCIHIARSFTFVPKTRVIGIRGHTKLDRAYNALAVTGGTAFGGVTMTKIIGVCVLMFAQSQIFRIYYFKMWSALIVLVTIHSLALLPVLLSIAGGRPGLSEGEDNEFTGLEDI